MSLKFICSSDAAPSSPKKRKGHTKPVTPLISLDAPGRLRVAHLLAVFAVSHSTLYAGIKTGRYPKADGMDGRIPYWNTQTVKMHLENGGPA